LAELALPEKYELSQNYPNPFNPTTQIRYQLPNTDKVRITIYNLSGQVVRTLVDTQVQAGYHITQWDGRSDQGMSVSSGIYYYRIETKSYTMTKKMALLK
jgi:flagellar hook assembly protein FlgD